MTLQEMASQLSWGEKGLRYTFERLARLMGKDELTPQIFGFVLECAVGDEKIIMEARVRGARILIQEQDGQIAEILPHEVED